jgi:hypothetical protein
VQKWIVLEENPWPDNYIVIMVAEETRVLKVEKRPCSVFTNDKDALQRARELQKQFGAKSIKIFYLDGHSETIYGSSL